MGQPRIGNVLDAPATDIVPAVPVAENILAVYRQATVAELAEGLDWYSDAHKLACTLSPEDPREAAGVIAALSPMMPWDRNQALAVRAYADNRTASGALGGSVAKANRILNGESPEKVLGGKKVRAFYGIIADPSSDAVCVDRHAFDIAVGQVTNNESRQALSRKGIYEAFADAYVSASKTLSEETGMDISASQVQAVTWTVWRRLKGLV